jgi:phenylalanyl-tRNA synthetase beta chain
VLVGLGLTEIMTLVLTCPAASDRLLSVPDHPATVLVENPISQEQNQLRTSLLPGILATLAGNRHNPLPQGIFEVGDVTLLDASAETGARDLRHLAFGLTAPRAGFAELRPLVEGVVREFGWPFTPQAYEAPFFIAGRGARFFDPTGVWAGIFGEAHPAVLERLGLQNPVVLMEMVLPFPGEIGEYRSFVP